MQSNVYESILVNLVIHSKNTITRTVEYNRQLEYIRKRNEFHIFGTATDAQSESESDTEDLMLCISASSAAFFWSSSERMRSLIRRLASSCRMRASSSIVAAAGAGAGAGVLSAEEAAAVPLAAAGCACRSCAFCARRRSQTNLS